MNKKYIKYLIIGVLVVLFADLFFVSNIREVRAADYGDWTYSVIDSKSVKITGYKGSLFSYVVDIPSTINGKKVTEIGDNAFDKNDFEKVIIPDGVTTIGKHAFDGHISLKIISIPDSVTTIGEYAFYKCEDLPEITIPDSVTSIGACAFCECKEAETITISKNLTSIENGLFSECESVSEIIIPGGVTSIGDNAFASCKGLTDITIPDSVTTIGESAFSWCVNLTDITIPDSVTSIGSQAFECCESLTDVILPNGITRIENGLFSFCPNLEYVPIPEGVTYIGDSAFSSCGISQLDLPDSLSTIESGAFSNCHLRSIKIPYGITEIYRDTFFNCRDLKYVVLPESLESIENSFNSCVSLEFINIPYSVTRINEYAFNLCDKIVFYVEDGSCGKQYAITNGINCKDISLFPDKPDDLGRINYIKDTWGFINPDSEISTDKYLKFFNPNKARMLHQIDDGTKGQCFGMSMSVASVLLGYPTVSSYGNYTDLNKVPYSGYSMDTRCSAIDLVSYAHIYQYMPQVQKERNNNENDYDGLVRAIKDFESGGEPVEIDMFVENDEHIRMGHTLLGIKVRSFERDRTVIQVYDSNEMAYNRYKELILYKISGKYTGWSYYHGEYGGDKISWNSEMEGAELEYSRETTSFKNDFINDIKVKANLLGFGFSSNLSESEIMDMMRCSIVYNGTTFSYQDLKDSNEDVISISSSDYNDQNADNSHQAFWLMDDSKELKIKGLPQNTTMSLTDDNLEISAESSGQSEITINLDDNECEVSGNDDDLHIDYINYADDKFCEVSFDGKSYGDSIITKGDDEYYFSGIKECEISVGLADEAPDKVFKTSDLSSEAYYKAEISQDNTIAVFEDKDCDGEYESVVKTDSEETPSEESKEDSTDNSNIRPTEEPSAEPSVPGGTKAPAKPTLKSIKNTKGKKLTVRWKRVYGAKGYEIQYSTNKKFKKAKTKTTKKTTFTIKKLKKKTYYVRIRAYKVDSFGKKVYGVWSKTRKVKIKR